MTERSADLPYKTREVAMLTSRRMLSLLLAAAAVIAILSGCYAPASTETDAERSTQESNASSTVKLGGYPVPTENVTSGIMCACMQTQDGFWLWTMGGKRITAFEPANGATYTPCSQVGCKHTDTTCSAYFGTIEDLVEYDGSFYALVSGDDFSSISLVTRPVSGGALQTLARWKATDENTDYRCNLRCISFGKAYIGVIKLIRGDIAENGSYTEEKQSKLVSVDLKTGEISTAIEEASQYALYGVWENTAIFRVTEMVEDAPEFEEWLAQQPEGTAWDEYDRQFIRYRFLTRNLQTGEEQVLVDTSENFVMTVDFNRCWNQFVVYQVNNSLYVYDMEKKASKLLVTPKESVRNYWIMDGCVNYLVRWDDAVGAFAVDVATGEISEIDNHGAGLLEYSPLYESDGYFVGVNGKSENDARNYYIRKEDYYSGNFSAAFY